MTQYILCICLLFNFTTPNSYLNYHKLINQATNAAHQKKYEKADSLFRESIQIVEIPFIKDYVFAIDNAIKLKDFDKAFFYLKTAIQLGLSKKKIEQKSWFYEIQIREEWFLLEKEYPALWEKYESQFEPKLRQEILKIYQRDQDFRLNGGEDFDANNLERLKKIILEKGYPSHQEIGQDIDLHIVFHHFLPKDNERFFYKTLHEAVLKGNISPYEYAAIIDYDQLKENKLPIYGTYFKTIDGIRYLQSIEDFDAINELRKEIGLEPIEQFMEKFNVIYDSNFIRF